MGTIVFGIGVDDSIHIVDRIKDEGETPAGIVKSVARTGQTIFETTATTSAGLAAGLFVSIPGLRNFFVLMMFMLLIPVIWITKVQVFPIAVTPLLMLLIVRYYLLSKRLLSFKK